MADIPRLERRPEARAFSVETLLQYVQEGRLRPAGFVRPLRWRAPDVLDLFDSIYRGFPVGDLLFARQAAEAGTLHFGPLQVKAPNVTDALLIVDGQERLTALAAALLHPDTRPRGDIYAVWFDLEAQTFRRLETPEAPLHWIPLNAVANPARLLGWLKAWPLSAEREDLAQRALALSTALRTYQFPAYVVAEASRDALTSIFRRLNTSGVSLREVELLDASLSALEPRPITAACRRLEETGFGAFPDELFLRCLEAVEGSDSAAEEPVENRFDPDAVNRTEAALRRVIAFLVTDAGIPHARLLPYRLPLIVLARFFHLTPEPSPRTRLLLSRWVWRGALSHAHELPDGRQRYRLLSGASEDPHLFVEHLLSTVPRTSSIPSSSAKWSPHEARTKLSAIALFHLGPRDPQTQAVFDLQCLQDLLSRADLNHVFPAVGGTSPSSIARHVLLAAPEKLSLLPKASPNVLHSHGIDEEAAEALRRQVFETFEQRRTRTLDSWFERFFRERSAPDESDRPSIPELIRRVDERASTP